ncbi:glycosyltransferase family 9 protein [bacterium]|nr:glycosyltransferase family 9 protein [candidate division CSSED10-310 bacterium]
MKPENYKIINRRKLGLVMAADWMLSAARSVGLIRTDRLPLLPNVAPDIRRVLLIRLAYIGDVIMTQPVTRVVREAFPNASVHFLTSSAATPLLQRDPCIDRVISFDAPWFYRGVDRSRARCNLEQLAGAYDLGIDFRGDIRNIWHCLYRPGIPYRLSYSSGGGGALLTHPISWTELKHKVEFHLDLLRKAGFPAERRDPVIHLSGDEITGIRERLDRIPACRGVRPIVIHPGSRLPLKRWSVAHFTRLIHRLDQENLGPVVLVESRENASITGQLRNLNGVQADFTGALSIREMAALFRSASVLICHDSAPMHIAAASGCRVVALFGPSRPLETAPSGTGHRIIEAACNLKDRCDESRCLDRYRGCMDRIDVETVVDAVRAVLKS